MISCQPRTQRTQRIALRENQGWFFGKTFPTFRIEFHLDNADFEFYAGRIFQQSHKHIPQSFS